MLKPLSDEQLKILTLLEEDSQVTDESLAQAINQSVEELQKLRRELEEEGIILKYRAIINWEKIESSEVIALIQVNVTPELGTGYDVVAQKICQFEEVNTCLLVSGQFDLLVEVTGPSLKDVAFFVADKLATIKGVEHTRTNFLLKRYKQMGDVFTVAGKTHRLPVAL